MKLEINTNGAWRTVLDGITPDLPATYRAAMTAAATLAALDAGLRRRPQTWRLVDTENRVVSYCVGAQGWTDRAA